MFRNALFLVVCCLCLAVDLPAQTAGSRQYYSGWTRHASRPYYYRYYYYKAGLADKSYRYHYGIYYPSRGKRVYMYNPHAKRYWGYWEGDSYSLLPQDKRKESIDDIAAEDFPKPAKAPAIPEAEGNEAMLAPPSDFPKLDDDTP